MARLGPYAISDAIELPPKRDYGIGVIGCGGIVNLAHLPAYTAHGLNIVACFDQIRATAERTADAHGVGRIASSLDDLLADPRVEIVDIAITPSAQAGVAVRAAAAGKHMLCQKPLSDDYSDARAIVGAARAAGVKLAVNQQMRWNAGMRVSRQLIDQGALGAPANARIETSVRTPWHLWPWIAAAERLEVMHHSIHYLDSLRFLFGDPLGVTAVHGRNPGQLEVGETRTTTVLHYENGLQALVDVNHHDWSDDAYSRFRFLGDRGIIRGTNGTLYDYPSGRVDSLEFQANDEPKTWREARLSTRWIPDAFIGPMASLMDAIQTDGDPLTSGEDNLKTLQVVFAAYRSAAEGRTVSLAEIASVTGRVCDG